MSVRTRYRTSSTPETSEEETGEISARKIAEEPKIFRNSPKTSEECQFQSFGASGRCSLRTGSKRRPNDKRSATERRRDKSVKTQETEPAPAGSLDRMVRRFVHWDLRV